VAEKRRLYWDSCNFISLVNPDEARRAEVCRRILEDAESGKLEIVTSALTIVEVHKAKEAQVPQEIEQKIGLLFEQPYIMICSVDRPVAERARDLCRLHGLRVRDAVHLATALVVEADVFQTYNCRDFARLRVPIAIEEPKWEGNLEIPFPPA
jgi:predicted nucleic acid-binding protein